MISLKVTQMLFLVTLLMMVLHQVHGAPNPSNEWNKERSLCASNVTVIETCQMCAKQTKSPIVYPMCCHDQDNVFEWCVKYISYGKLP